MSEPNGHDFKQLKTRQAKLKAELERLDIERREAAKAYDEMSKKLKVVEKEIEDYTREPIVSEHAMLRYIEREMGFDMDAIKAAILTEELKKMIKTLGNGKYPVGSHKAVVKNMVVVSIA